MKKRPVNRVYVESRKSTSKVVHLHRLLVARQPDLHCRYGVSNRKIPCMASKMHMDQCITRLGIGKSNRHKNEDARTAAIGNSITRLSASRHVRQHLLRISPSNHHRQATPTTRRNRLALAVMRPMRGPPILPQHIMSLEPLKQALQILHMVQRDRRRVRTRLRHQRASLTDTRRPSRHHHRN